MAAKKYATRKASRKTTVKAKKTVRRSKLQIRQNVEQF